MTSPSDADLLAPYVGPNEADAKAALEALIKCHASKLRNKALRLNSFNATDADDLFAETLLRLWSRRGTYDSSQAPWIVWAIRVMCGCASDQRKKRRGKLASRMQSAGDSPEWMAGNEMTPDRIAFGREFAESFAECLQRLDAQLRDVFVLCFEGEQTLEQVSETLGLGGGAGPVSRRYDKATKQLGNCLRSKDYGPGDKVDGG